MAASEIEPSKDNHCSSTINDICPGHHYDFHILDLNTKDQKIITSFGMQHNDIPIHSELLSVDINDDDIKDHKRHANANFVSKFIAYIITHQCPRNDVFLFDTMKIQKRARYEYIDDWTPYFDCVEQWVMQMLYTRAILYGKSRCNKQLIIFQYAPTNEQTDIHPLALQDQMDKLIAANDKETIELLDNLREKAYKVFPNKMEQLRKLLNKLQNINVDEIHSSSQLPLFVHHFYPKSVQLSRNMFQTLSQKIMNFTLPSEVISIIVQFAIIGDNSMFYDCWYLQRNAQKSGNTLVELWDNLLFNKNHYTLTENNKYNGVINNIWIPSQYLLENENNCLANIVNEIRNNNILHIYRQITWSIFLQINSLNDLYTHDVEDMEIDKEEFYKKKLQWNEWSEVYVSSNIFTAIQRTTLYVFGGHMFNTIYSCLRMLLVQEYDISAGMITQLNEIFKEKLDKRMKQIFPVIIPTEYQLIEIWLNSVDDPPFIYEYFYQAQSFDPLLKCYLLELMLFDGMDALVLTFGAFIKLKSTELFQLYANFAEEDSDEEMLKKITKKLFGFKDVKSMSKLYIQYRKEIMDNCSDKIKLKNNPLIIPVEYRKNPPTKEEYRNDGNE